MYYPIQARISIRIKVAKVAKYLIQELIKKNIHALVKNEEGCVM